MKGIYTWLSHRHRLYGVVALVYVLSTFEIIKIHGSFKNLKKATVCALHYQWLV